MSSAMLVLIVQTLLLPPLSLFLLYAAGWAMRGRWPRLGNALSIGAVTILLLLCTNAGARLLLQPLELSVTPLQSAKATGAQAIVVLAAGRHANSPEYGGQSIPDNSALARLRYAARLHRETALPVLVTGGTAGPMDRLEPLAHGMARVLQEDFATPVTWIEDQSRNTVENAAYSVPILQRAAVHRILLVTDAMHMRRARGVFVQAGLQVVAAPTVFSSNKPLALFDFLPSAEGLGRSHYALHEWLGITWNCVRQWV